ncbi:MAG: NADH-quinone oxidoreductase subunit H [Candidatus Goldbacteria bacterium]|nr:NADH-quinone oxidoreductase subunit H [Candidatus Goldiibacteriota bacterium]
MNEYIKELILKNLGELKNYFLLNYQVIIEFIIKMFILYFGIFSFAALLTILERKISALIQDRVGPEKANIWKFRLWGLFHPIADGIKIIMKEDFIPKNANKFMFSLAPIITVFSSLIVFAFIPFGNYIQILDHKIKLILIETDIAIFLIIALSSLAIYGVFMGGVFSANSWGILGSMRAIAQLISYEVITLISLLPIILIYTPSTLHDLVEKQSDMFFGIIPNWGIILQPFAFIFFFTAALCENKRIPFDVVEGESEIIGYFTEYSSMRFGAFMFAEYIEIIFFSMLITIFFLGGWNVPFLKDYGFKIFNFVLEIDSKIVYLLELISFIIKVFLVSFIIIFTRWTLPRFRFDQILRLSWEYILPLSIANIIFTAILIRII